MILLSTAFANAAQAVATFFIALWSTVFLESRPFRWLYGFDKDQRNFCIKDGTGLFTVLATFALAQGAALAQLAKGEYEWVALGIYLLTFILTVGWVVSLLRADIGDVGQRRTYDRPTIRYGRWVLTWVLLEGVVLIFLATNRLLPNQTKRVLYDQPKIDFTVETAPTHYGTAQTPRRKAMDQFVRWFDDRRYQAGGYEFFWIQQINAFEKNYYTFVAELHFEPASCELGQRVAFLLSGDGQGNDYRPTYRQIPFNGDPSADGRLPLLVEEPDKGQKISILLYAKKRNPEPLAVPQGAPPEVKRPTADECAFKLTHPMGG